MLTYFIIISLTLFFITIYIYTSLKDYFTSQKKIEYLTMANVIANTVSGSNYYNNLNESLNGLNESNKKEVRIFVLNKDAKVLYDTNTSYSLVGKAILKDEVLTALKGKDDANISKDKEQGWIFDIAVPIIKNREITGVVYIATSAKEVMDFINEVLKNLIFISVFLSILIGVLSAVFAGIITEPIERLTKFIGTISKSGHIPKIDINRNDEIGQLSDAFNQMSDKLNELDEKKKSFLANASHEFKTPLSTIKLLSDSIIQMENTDVILIKEFLQDINCEVERLNLITEGLLSLTKLEILENDVKKRRININELINKITDSLKMVADFKNIQIVFDQTEIFHIITDYDKLWQVIYNIVDNGVKYTKKGGQIEIKILGDEAVTKIIISDNGIGIPKEDLPKIFDKFYRVDKARARETGGTGLGLSIAYSAITLLGGQINVNSIEGEGTEFTIILPNWAN